MIQKNYEEIVLQSATEEYEAFRRNEINKSSAEVFDNSEKILQYKAALLALKRKGLTKEEARVLYTMRGRILRSIVEPETIGGVNYGA